MEFWVMHPDSLVELEARKRGEAIKSARQWRIADEMAGSQPRWTRKQSCWVLCQLGRLLINIGQHLEQYGTPQVA